MLTSTSKSVALRAKLHPVLIAKCLLGVAWLIVLVTLFVFAVDPFVTSCSGDSCLYIYVGKGILQGEIPYLDRWDNKGPLIHLLNLVGLLIDESWGIFVVQGFFLLATTWCAFLVLRNGMGILPALFALALFLVFFAKFNPPGNFTEQYGLLFQFLTLYLFVRSEAQSKSMPSRIHFALLHVSIGMLGAASFLLRPNLVALWIAIGIFWILMRGTSLYKLAWAILGGGSVLVLVAGLFVSFGALDEFWDAVFVYNFSYSMPMLHERLEVIWFLTTEMFPISLVVVLGWCAGTFLLFRRRLHIVSFKGLLVISLILLPIEVISLSLSGFPYRHYFLPALPAISLIMAFLACYVLTRRSIGPSLPAIGLLVVAVYYSLSNPSFVQLADKYTREGAIVSVGVRLRGLIQESTGPNDTILVWGKGAWIYLESDRDAPTRFFYDIPLTKPNYTNQAILDEFFSDVTKNMPKLIIDMRTSRMPPLASAERQDWRPERRYMHDLKDFEPFFNFVEKSYLAVDTFTAHTIYSLKHVDTANQAPIQGQLIIRSTYDIYLDGRTLTYVRSPCANDDAAKRFILHVFPVDNSVIDGNEHHTMDFSFIEGEHWYVGESCVVSRELPDFEIAYIRTGQYDITRSRHEWLSEYHFSRPN